MDRECEPDRGSFYLCKDPEDNPILPETGISKNDKIWLKHEFHPECVTIIPHLTGTLTDAQAVEIHDNEINPVKQDTLKQPGFFSFQHKRALTS
jgi:hypothetical protein